MEEKDIVLAEEANTEAANVDANKEVKDEKPQKDEKVKKEKPAKEEKVKKEKPAKEEKVKAEKPKKDKKVKEPSEPLVREFKHIELPPVTDEGVKGHRQKLRLQRQFTSKHSKEILGGNIISTTGAKPDVDKYVIELKNVKKNYVTGDILSPVLKGVDLQVERGKFIVILGPSGSGKTTLLNTISGLDKANEGDVFVLGNNLTLLKDSHLTKFRRENVGFIFQQYNLLSNLTAKENAEVGENLSRTKDGAMSIEDIFKTIGMEEQINKYPHQMSGGQQQRVSIARALAKNPEILFGDEPTGALDEEMGRKVLEILVKVKDTYNTTVIVVTHNPNISEIGDTVIHVKNGLIDSVKNNPNPKKPSDIDWS
ncbi:putative ABC transport system ATP-binding protein [Spiroplasma chinense]|uniref:Putative ABC transport system ATP-binding protein n=1 Tax=Spiroplasma chinense TaxID=216932 RepID=A0A5B9Y391_9MOLU|nr:ABC transporter ATP-binding protein [Spiroplasma chinense]QEH61213.1 putative ABC transport system ATP-binding protein [Spiroplasma chinense]